MVKFIREFYSGAFISIFFYTGLFCTALFYTGAFFKNMVQPQAAEFQSRPYTRQTQYSILLFKEAVLRDFFGIFKIS